MKPQRSASLGILLTASLLLAACRATPEAPATPEPSAAPTPTPRPTPAMTSPVEQGLEAADGAVITLWHVWEGERGRALEAIVQAFNADNEHGITVVAADQGSYDQIDQNVKATLESGETPHLALGYAYQYLAWEASGEALVDLDPYFQDPRYGLAAEADDFYPAFLEQDMVGGRRLGVPAQPSGQFLFYNQTWAGELGFASPPATPEEFRQQACAAAQANGDGTGGWLLSTQPAAVAGWLYAFGVDFEAPGEGYRFNTPQTLAAFEFLYDLQREGCAWQPQARFPNLEFASRQGLFYASSLAGLEPQRTAFKSAGNPDEWTVIPFPAAEGDPVVPSYGPSLVMFASSPGEQAAAWLFLRHFLSPESQAAWAQAGGALPTRAGALESLEGYMAANPQWAAAAELLPYARHEPRFKSWGLVRGALQDAARELFRPAFERFQVPKLVEDLDLTAQELHAFSGGY